MTGPEHYSEAERLLSGAQNVMDVAPVDGLTRTECAALAQVHATLALVAATAMQAAVDGSEPGMGSGEYHEWYVAAGVKSTNAEGGTR